MTTLAIIAGAAIVDPYGHILEQTTYLEPTQAILIADLPLGSADAPYLILGDWLGWIALAGMAFFTFFSKIWRGWKRKGRPGVNISPLSITFLWVWLDNQIQRIFQMIVFLDL